MNKSLNSFPYSVGFPSKYNFYVILRKFFLWFAKSWKQTFCAQKNVCNLCKRNFSELLTHSTICWDILIARLRKIAETKNVDIGIIQFAH